MKEAVCCCGHFRSSHNYPIGKTECQVPGCRCKSFTDKRRSKRLAESKATREAGPKAEIIKLLESKDIRHFRMQSGDIVVQVGARKRRIMGNGAGTPDILCLIRRWVGKWGAENHDQIIMPLWIEVKKSDGNPSDEQISFQKTADLAGESYLIARSVEDVANWLNQIPNTSQPKPLNASRIGARQRPGPS